MIKIIEVTNRPLPASYFFFFVKVSTIFAANVSPYFLLKAKYIFLSKYLEFMHQFLFLAKKHDLVCGSNVHFKMPIPLEQFVFICNSTKLLILVTRKIKICPYNNKGYVALNGLKYLREAKIHTTKKM
jgi:hypothetical protein